MKQWKVKEKRQRSDYEREQELGGSRVMERRGQSWEERDRWVGEEGEEEMEEVTVFLILV